MTQTEKTSILTATIDRIEDDQVVFFIDKNEFTFPKSYFPQKIKEGSLLNVYISLDTDKELNKETLAKNILNEILNPSYEKAQT